MSINSVDYTSYAVVDQATGSILRTGYGEVDMLAAQHDPIAQDVIAPVPDDVSDDTHYWSEAAGLFMPLPPCPGIWAVWDGQSWTDPRTPDDLAAEMEARREAASMARPDLVIAAVTAGIIPASDAAPAARGEITPTIQVLIDRLPPEVRVEATVRWAGSTRINRTNQILTAIAAEMGVTDQQLDELFGVTAPLPEE